MQLIYTLIFSYTATLPKAIVKLNGGNASIAPYHGSLSITLSVNRYSFPSLVSMQALCIDSSNHKKEGLGTRLLLAWAPGPPLNLSFWRAWYATIHEPRRLIDAT